MTAKHWVGLDVGVYQTSVCVTDDAGQIVDEADLATQPITIIEMLSAYPNVGAIGLETGVGTHLTLALRQAGLNAIMFDAFKASRFLTIRRNKTDKNDARGLAEIARFGRGAVTEVLVRGPECQAIRSKLKLRRGIIKQRIAAEGLMRSLLQTHGRTLGRAHSPVGFRTAVTAILEAISADEPAFDPSPDLLPLLDFCENIRRYIRVLDNDLARLARKSEVCRRLMTVPGVGPVCALSFYSAIEDPWRFGRIENIGAYLGLTPLVKETGGRSGRGRVSKAGDTMTRANLYISARVLMSNGHRDCALTAWAAALKKRVGATRGRVALARKLAIVMAAIWKSGGVFTDFPQPLLREASPEPR
jgi:transposase